jgi:tetratricopeptide (TPR) repeat protein
MLKKILIGLGLFFLVLIILFFTFGFNDLLSPGEYANHELLRSNYEEELSKTKSLIENNPDDIDSKIHLAHVHYYLGQFEESKKVITEVINQGESSFDNTLLLAKINYLEGNYETAIDLIEKEIQKSPRNIDIRLNGEQVLMYSYYQTNQFDKMKNLKVLKYIPPATEMIKWFNSFEGEAPYQIDWNGNEYAEVEFSQTNPIPVFQVELNGREMTFILDTGGDSIVLDNQTAKELGIEQVASVEGEGGGGLKADVGLGRADSLKLGDVTIKNVPVNIIATRRFSSIFSEEIGEEVVVEGVLTTKVFQQLFGTVDYENKKLVFRPKTAASKNAFLNEISSEEYVESSFYLTATHMMMTPGTIKGRPVMFFMDSGLEDEYGASLSIQKKTLLDLGIPVPETAVNPSDIGGLGGAGYEIGHAEVGGVGIGSFIQEDQLALYDPGMDNMYWGHGFITDALLSHNYLKNYDSWTLDFHNMKMYLVE